MRRVQLALEFQTKPASFFDLIIIIITIIPAATPTTSRVFEFGAVSTNLCDSVAVMFIVFFSLRGQVPEEWAMKGTGIVAGMLREPGCFWLPFGEIGFTSFFFLIFKK